MTDPQAPPQAGNAMATLPSYHVQHRSHGPQKTCASCGQIVLANLTFCPNCSSDMRSIPENVRSAPDGRTQFQIPSFLLADAPSRRYDDPEIGTGIVWVGLALIAIPALTRNLSPLSLGAWAAGIVLTSIGIARARGDNRAMMRAGLVTAAAGLLTLLVLGNQIVRHAEPTDRDLAVSGIQQTPTAESNSAETPMQAVPTGSSPMFRGSPEHTGLLAGPALAGSPYRVWRYDTGEDLRSTPAITGGVAYFGTRDGYLVALDLVTQKPKWTFDLGGYPVRASPAVGDRTVFLASGYNVFAVDADTGELRWKTAIDYAGESSPTVVDGMVYVASKEDHLYALDTTTGEQAWIYKTDGLLFGSPSVDDGIVVIGGDDGDLFAIDRETGHARWKVAFESAIYSTPAIADGLVYVTTQDKTTTAVDLNEGTIVWSYPVGGSASPAVADGVVFVGSDDGAVYALDARTGGDPLWIYATGNPTVESPVVAGAHLLFAAGSMILSLDRSTGEVNWRYPVGDLVTTDPVVLDGYLFAGDKSGYFSVLTGDASLATPPPTEDRGAGGGTSGSFGST
ncbi:MAG: PQQ-binding-like beta-propeller repeat protein [Thermomicrobiales bacterium]|nr:PQQ-binding-like beta-propeller repeat protein [Thermomicrobiales bacterium]